MTVRERAIQFGEGNRLLGILATPQDLTHPARAAVIIPNTGVEHRVGPNRLHVQLSRAFAQAGYPTLRMDLSGLGDSRASPGGGHADAVTDLRCALDELARVRVAERFVTVGLCSGGHDAHLLSVADPRIVGGAFIDHYAYRTLRSHYHYWAQRMTDLGRMQRFLGRLIRPRDPQEALRFDRDEIEYFVAPRLHQFQADIDALMARRVGLYFLYTGELQRDYNYRAQLFDCCPALRNYASVALHFRPDSDHTFSQVRKRQEVVQSLTDWLRQTFQPSE